jgi:glucose dehydrogenase
MPERYVMAGYRKFTDALGAPWIKPPWGKLNAIDLGTGEIRWAVPLGNTLTWWSKASAIPAP